MGNGFQRLATTLRRLRPDTTLLQGREEVPLCSVLPIQAEERQFWPEETRTQIQTQTWAQSPEQWKTESPQLAWKRESEGSEAHHEDVLARGAGKGNTLLTCH